MATPAQARQHRADLSELVRLAHNDLGILFREFDNADDARAGLMDTLPRLVAIYGSAAATLGADWYDEVRDAHGAPGRFLAIPADLPDRGRTDALARWGISPLFSATPSMPTALTKVAGGLQRIIADADRTTITTSSVQDRAASGWTRTGAGRCNFCSERVGLRITSDVIFESHDDCGCMAVPAF